MCLIFFNYSIRSMDGACDNLLLNRKYQTIIVFIACADVQNYNGYKLLDKTEIEKGKKIFQLKSTLKKKTLHQTFGITKVTYAKCLVPLCAHHTVFDPFYNMTIMLQAISSDTTFGKHICISENCECLQIPSSPHVA